MITVKISRIKKNLIAAILCGTMIFGAFSVTALAVGEDGAYDDPVATDVYDDPTDPDVEETDPEVTEEPTYEDVTDPDMEETTEEETQEETEDPDYTVEETIPETTEEEYDYTEEETTKYYFDTEEDYDPDVTYEEYTTPTVNLYKSDSKVDTNTLNKDDWSKILMGLQNANGSDDGDDFSAIQNNTAKGDSGQWYLYLGIAFVVASVLGFAFAFVSWQKQRKAYASAGGGKKSDSSAKKSTARHSSTSRDKSDYGDSYSQQSKKISKQDTADINLPKCKGSSNGRHFK